MKQGWEIKKFSDVVWFQEGPGVRKHQYTSEGIKLINVANLVNGVVDLSTSDRYISIEEAYGKYKHFLVDEGDLILASSGIQVEYIEKKMGFIHKEHLPLCMNTSTIRFKALNRTTLDMTFFMYYLKSFDFKIQLKKLITGIAQLNFGPSHLKQMSIPIPPLPEQEKIVAELDCLSGIIENKKQQLKELDALAESIFYTMFGDPITNEKGWEVKPLKESVEEMFLGPFGSALKTDCYVDKDNSYCMVYEQKHAIRKTMNVETHYINQEKFESLKRFEVHSGDFIMSCRGTIGEIYRLPNNAPMGIIHPSLMKIRINKDVYQPIFFISLLTRIVKNEDTNGNCVQMAITAKELGARKPIIPPLSLQQEFADKIEAIEKQKELIKQSITETEELFNSRMDYYFG